MKIKGPFYLAAHGSVEIDGKVFGEDKPSRHNDGSFIIMEGVRDGDDVRPVLNVLPQHSAKRGQGWNTPDPDGEAFARAVIDLLNQQYQQRPKKQEQKP